MAIDFDQGLLYQFVLFFMEMEDDPQDLKDLPGIINALVPNTNSFGLRLGKDRESSIVAASKSGIPPLPLVQWQTVSGIWKLTWSPLRLDLVFNARGFADMASELGSDATPDLGAIVGRVSANLSEVVRRRKINRMALIVSAKSSCQNAMRPGEVVARRFFTPSLIEEARRGDVIDVTGKANYLGRIGLASGRSGDRVDIRLNRNEQGVSALQYEDNAEIETLNWQLDVNTSPNDLKGDCFAPESVVIFLESSENWISERLNDLERLSG